MQCRLSRTLHVMSSSSHFRIFASNSRVVLENLQVLTRDKHTSVKFELIYRTCANYQQISFKTNFTDTYTYIRFSYVRLSVQVFVQCKMLLKTAC